jgi:hypothetical protein
LNGDPIPCEEILIRLISRSKDVLPTGEAASEVFILRRGEERLSVFRKAISDIELCKRALNRPRGAATLHTGRIRTEAYPNERQIDIVEAEGEGTEIPGHAVLIGLPDPEKEYGEAERVASLLRQQSRGIPIS